nr:hypothetical protein [Tanacetum cinerariifolium]
MTLKHGVLYWATAMVHQHFIRFKKDTKKHIVDLEAFRKMLHISLRVPGQSFAELPFEEEILEFLRFFGHSAQIKTLTDVNVNKLYQPWRSFAAVINKCLTGKSSGFNSLRLSQAQILWGLYHKRNVDYAFLIWKDLVYQVEHKNQKKSNEMKPKASARKKKSGSASSTTPPTPIATPTTTTTIVAAPRLSAAAKGKQPARATSPTDPSDVERTDAKQLKIVLRRSRHETHISHKKVVPVQMKELVLYQGFRMYHLMTQKKKFHGTLPMMKMVSEEEETTEKEEESFDPIPKTPEDGMESIFTTGSSTVTPIPSPKSTMTPSIITTTTTASQPPIPPTPIPSKQPARATSPTDPSDFERTEAKQLKIVLRRSRHETHISQKGGSSTDEGTGSIPGVPDVPSDDSEEEISWNSSDDEDGDDQTKGSDDKEGEKTDESDDDDDQDEAEKVNDDDDDEEEISKIDEQKATESGGDNEETKSDGDDGNGEEDQGLRISKEERMHEEEEADEIYRDVDINQGRGLQVSQDIEDSHVTLTLTHSDGKQESSSISSFVTSLLNPIIDPGMESIFTTGSSTVTPIPSPKSTMTPSIITTTTTASQLPIPPTPIPRDIFPTLLTFASVFRFEDRALVEAYDADKTILYTFEESAILKRRREEDDDQEGPSAGSDRGSKRRREGGEHASASTPSEPATGSAGRSTTGTQSRQLSARKLSNLTVEERFAFNVSLRMFTRSIVIQRRVEDLQLGVESYQKRLNLTKPDTYRSDLKRREAYTAYLNPRGFIYQNRDKKNRLMRIDELHKFSDGYALDDRLKGIRMQYLPTTIWRKGDKDRTAAMIQAIDKMLKTKRIMRSLERFVGGRQYEGDF